MFDGDPDFCHETIFFFLFRRQGLVLGFFVGNFHGWMHFLYSKIAQINVNFGVVCNLGIAVLIQFIIVGSALPRTSIVYQRKVVLQTCQKQGVQDEKIDNLYLLDNRPLF